MRENYNSRLGNKNNVTFTDLTSGFLSSGSSASYICEYCSIPLIPYHDIKGERITAGKLFECPRCGIIKDTAMNDIRRPIRLETSSALGGGDPITNIHTLQERKPRAKPYDIDESDDARIKAEGGSIKSTVIKIGDTNKIVRRD